ncbi:MAG: TIGR02757 family protein [Nitrospirae bacterium]|nr:TIGR02757 family protein [Nitrospirota bacterium]
MIKTIRDYLNMAGKKNPSHFKIQRNQLLVQLYREFDFRSSLSTDPVGFLSGYRKVADIEGVAFISSALAFGRIELFKPVIAKILEMGKGDFSQFILDFNPSKDKSLFKDIYYRIWTGEDLACLIMALKTILIRHGSLESLFLKYDNPAEESLEQAMIHFSEEWVKFNPEKIYGINQFTRSFKAFVPSPRSGSACKRFCLFLRWMVRKGDLDSGIWNSASPSRLIIPLDTNIIRIGRFLRLTRLKTAGWKMAKEITKSLKEIDPEDPLKFDFPLCHFSIRGICLAKEPGTLCGLCQTRKNCYFKT